MLFLFLFFCCFMCLFFFFHKKLYILLIIETLMITSIFMYYTFSRSINFSFLGMILLSVLMVLDSILGVCILILSQRSSVLVSSFNFF